MMSRYRDLLVLGCVLVVFVTVNAWLFSTGRLPLDGHGIGVMLAAGVTLAIFSFLYKDNPAFKAVENLYVGVGLGYTVVIGWFNFLKPDVFDALLKPACQALIGQATVAPKWSLVPPSVLGLFMLLRISRRLSWLSRWSVAFIMGAGAGMAIPLTISSYLLKQSWATMMPLISWGAASPAFDWNGALILLGVVCVLSYFFFSVEHKGAMAVTSRIGIWYLMISFGASFGFTVMARVSLLTGRFQFLMHDWLRVID